MKKIREKESFEMRLNPVNIFKKKVQDQKKFKTGNQVFSDK